MKFNTPLTSFFLTADTNPCPITFNVVSVSSNNLGSSFAKIEGDYLYFSTTELQEVTVTVRFLNLTNGAFGDKDEA